MGDRWQAMAVAAVLACTAGGASAQLSAESVKGVLASASDAALDRLAQPGAFSADDAIRIALPGASSSAGSSSGLGDLMKLADRAGVTKDLSANLNRAAEQAAGQAKPIFRAAIDRLSPKDMVGIATGGKTAATDYLRQSSGAEIAAKLAPLVRSALQGTGVFASSSQLSSLGLTDAKLTDYVTRKTSDGIFTYVGREETKARENPLETGRAVLKGLKF